MPTFLQHAGDTLARLSIAAFAVTLTAVPVGSAADEGRSVDEHLAEIEQAAQSAKAKAGPAERTLIDADLAFAADAGRRHVADAFADRFLANGLLLSPGTPTLSGPDAVREALQVSTAEWYWAPVDARVSGDLGVTRGIAAIVAGDGQVYRTRYVTVWEKDGDGEWRIWLDIGNRDPGPATIKDRAEAREAPQ